ncbi:MAG: hypothetical protein RR614_09850, partial [Eubacterium sp.]
VADNGKDTNDGLSPSTPLATLAAAYAKLPENGIIDTNHIVITGTVSTDGIGCFTKPAKIIAEAPEKGILALTADSTLSADTAFESITLKAEDKAILGKAEANPKPNLTLGPGLGIAEAPVLIGSIRDIGTLSLKNANLKINTITPADKLDELRLCAKSQLTLGGSATFAKLGSYDEDNITPSVTAQSTLTLTEGSELNLTGTVSGITTLTKEGSDPQKGITVKALAGTKPNVFTGENLTTAEGTDGVTWQIPPVENEIAAAPLEVNALATTPSLTTTAKIMAGKQYDLVTVESTSVTVSNKSAVTVEFDTTVSVGVGLLSSMTLNNTLPVGTKITMLDLSTASTPVFYKYIVSGSSGNILLTSFTKMEDSTKYALPTLAIGMKQKLVFVVDFSEVTASFTTGNLSLTHAAALLSVESTKATYTIASPTNSLTASVSPATVNAKDSPQITLTPTMDPKDTRFKNGGVLAVSLWKTGETQATSLKNTTIKSTDGKTYYALNSTGTTVYIPV